jgi:hypothetical protein
MSKPYNGHPSYNAWNVSLWISNDEGLYLFALLCLDSTKTLESAARTFLCQVGATQTPDGVRYTMSTVKRALSNLRS